MNTKSILAPLRQFFLAALFSCGVYALHAQYVTIPDTSFVNWLNNNGFYYCLNGNQLDTTCSYILNVHNLSISYKRINNLDGVQYFKNLDSLKVNADTTLTDIPVLPPALQVLECRNNQLSALPVLPSTLTRLACEFNNLSSLPALPAALQSLTCYNNAIDSLPALPAGLKTLYCAGNPLIHLPALPDSLLLLSCSSNGLSQLPALPASLVELYCQDNSLTTLPTLPTGLKNLDCYTNTLSSLPSLPDSLCVLVCHHNKLTSLPALPAGLTILNCAYNKLTGLPATLPDSLYQLFCDHNAGIKCLPVIKTIWYFEFSGDILIDCVPTYGNVYISDPALNSIQICDADNNKNHCTVISGITETALPVFKVYPNPAKEYITVEADENAAISLFDAAGRVLLSTKMQGAQMRLNTQQLQAGLYLIKMAATNGYSHFQKVIVE
ncbi:MAG TPA: T9SS type A sorting domain-containing protein [Chitinophagales bacterium]|nr:T9SS type A sorting domain-containing protein [Chitinophagales bacterium]